MERLRKRKSQESEEGDEAYSGSCDFVPALRRAALSAS